MSLEILENNLFVKFERSKDKVRGEDFLKIYIQLLTAVRFSILFSIIINHQSIKTPFDIGFHNQLFWQLNNIDSQQ